VGEAFESNAGFTCVSSFTNAFVDVELLPGIDLRSIDVGFAIWLSDDIFAEVGSE